MTHRQTQLIFDRYERIYVLLGLCWMSFGNSTGCESGVRDQSDVGVEITFTHFCAYRVSDESFAFDSTLVHRKSAHWLYQASNTEFLQSFKRSNLHVNPHWELKHFIVVTGSEIVDIISMESPQVSERTDGLTPWLKPGEIDPEQK